MFHRKNKSHTSWLSASLVLAAMALAPILAVAQSCDQLYGHYQQNNYSWWWGAFGHCKTGPGGITDRSAIFECAWNQVPASDATACLRGKLLQDARTSAGIDAVVAYNTPPGCDQLFSKYQQNNFNWWWGALGNCKTGPGGSTNRDVIFSCAWNQLPANDQSDCLRGKLMGAAKTSEGIDVVVAYNSLPSCDQLFAKYQQNNFNWWWGALGNCKTGPGGSTNRDAIFNCAWNQLPAADQTACLKAKMLAAVKTNEGIDVVVAYNSLPSCDQLFAKYQQANFNWWWGALGNCKSGPGGIIDRTEVFECAWNQLPPTEQTACLKEKLRLAAKTSEGIDIVVAYNRPLTCDQLFSKYQQNSFNWWWGALGNCKTGPGGITDRAAIFECGWNQLPPNDQTACLKEKLRQDAKTSEGIDVVAAYNQPLTCETLFARYDRSRWWWGALGACKKPQGPTDRTSAFECAWSQVPVNDRTDCLKEKLRGTEQTRKGIDEVVAFNGVIANNRSTVTFTECADPQHGCPETCDLPTDGTVPANYFAPLMPPVLADGPLTGRNRFNDPPAHNIGVSEGRLRADLRAAARLADPLSCSLPLAAILYGQGKDELAQAFADLSVTGRSAFAKFSRKPLTQNYCDALPAQALAADCLPPVDPMPTNDAIVKGCSRALDRAYAVANFLRTGQALQTNADKQVNRNALGWIAVSGEDDLPHRPVNVPSSDYPQYNINVDVQAPLAKTPFAIPLGTPMVSVATRYVIAQSKAVASPATPASHWTVTPDEVPAIPADSDILVFVHGMDSRAEEAHDITKALFERMHNSSRNLVVIAVDLPTSGYTETLDYDQVSPLVEIGGPKWTPLPVPIVVPLDLAPFFAPALAAVGIPPLPIPIPPGTPPLVIPPGVPLPDFEATGRTPQLDFMEDFVVRFVDALDQQVPIKKNIKAVMGGSLGGNLSFRLGRRPNIPWLQNVIVWSPASIWNSLGEGDDILKHIGPRDAWEKANSRDPRDPNDLGRKLLGRRADFFGGWDKAIVPLVIPMAQSQTWTSKYWACKQSSIAAARLDRHETYDPRFLYWRWRLGGEQLLYSHQTIDRTTNLPRFMSNDKPMLLACGLEDDVPFNNICAATQHTAPFMTKTPGKALFLDKTGHSLDNERPKYWAQQIVEFLDLK